jgi:hypothetical protein
MTSAKKLDHNYPVLTSVPVSKNHTSLRTDKIHPLIKESRDILDWMGWSGIPDSMKLVIAIDMIGFRDELNGWYSTRDPYVLARRRSVYYWVNQYLNGNCTTETAEQSLQVLNLVKTMGS